LKLFKILSWKIYPGKKYPSGKKPRREKNSINSHKKIIKPKKNLTKQRCNFPSKK
jgi:hypothetical protein